MEVTNYDFKPSPRKIEGFKENDDVFLKIEIGNGQIGGTKVSKGDKLLAKGGLSQPTFLGSLNDLKNDEIEIETNILDVNSFTNMCVLTTSFFNQKNEVLYTKIDKGEAPEIGIASFKAKYKFLIVLILTLLNYSVFAQNSINEVSFKDLETPTSPGFILLDKTPASIQRPTTPQGFGISMLGFIQGSGGAIELAPFWLINHPNLSAENMYKEKFPIVHHFSISAATVKSDTTNFLAGGARTRIFQDYGNKRLLKLDSLRKLLEIALADLDIPKIKELQVQYTDIIENPLFCIDAAAAFSAGSVQNSFNDLNLNRWALWTTINYRPNGKDFYFSVLSRYINENINQLNQKTDVLDFGTRLNYDINSFCISMEYIQRFNTNLSNNSDYRIALIGSYKLSDNFYLTSTFGKNFTDVNNIIALAGINFGFSKSKMKAY